MSAAWSGPKMSRHFWPGGVQSEGWERALPTRKALAAATVPIRSGPLWSGPYPPLRLVAALRVFVSYRQTHEEPDPTISWPSIMAGDSVYHAA